MTGPFDIPEGVPRLEHAIVDEQTQMTRYLAEIAMEDIALLPHPSARRVRPGGLLDQYRKSAEAEHAAEAANARAEVAAIEEIVVSEVSRTSVPPVGPPPRDMTKEVREIVPGSDAEG